jgi:membrane-associated phospholipid phosphatase
MMLFCQDKTRYSNQHDRYLYTLLLGWLVVVVWLVVLAVVVVHVQVIVDVVVWLIVVIAVFVVLLPQISKTSYVSSRINPLLDG